MKHDALFDTLLNTLPKVDCDDTNPLKTVHNKVEGSRGTKYKNVTGLDNCFNSCYGNSILQVLARIEQLENLIIKPNLSTMELEL